MINVTKTFLPPYPEYERYLKRAWEKGWITNNGELVQELEAKLKDYLGVKHLFFTTNGTVVLQMALKALNITGQVITTPFSYVATTNAVLWEGCEPIFVDISPVSFCLDPDKIEAAITEKTQAILATHVYGLSCDIEKIEKIARKYHLKVIYDGAHAFGSHYKGKPLLSYGDLSTCSFHATKLFHTVEGGCIICHDDELAHKIMLYRQFGHVYDDYQSIGINAKNSEFHAAMGLANFPYLSNILEDRKKSWLYYQQRLMGKFRLLDASLLENFNYSYFPVVFATEEEMKKCKERLIQNAIYPRQYFHPSLNKLSFIEGQDCPVSEEISSKILCLPLFYEIAKSDIDRICQLLELDNKKLS
jgi:dTDP-4-amino-4,6-dideoxygalactose transaminase